MTTKLGPDDLRKSCNPDQFDFATTEDITAPIGIIGQERALRSLDFGLDINAEGFKFSPSANRARGRGAR